MRLQRPGVLLREGDAGGAILVLIGPSFGVLRILCEQDSLLGAALNSWIVFPLTLLIFHVVEFAVVADDDDAIEEVDEMEPEMDDKDAWARMMDGTGWVVGAIDIDNLWQVGTRRRDCSTIAGLGSGKEREPVVFPNKSPHPLILGSQPA